MNYRTLGRTGLQVSEIGLGTWALGSRIYGEVERDAPERLIKGAIEVGINFFDTAPLYGTREEDGVSEKILGAALGSDREKVLISTKFGRTSTNVVPGRFYAKEARLSTEASLRRLGTDRLDIFFFHSPFNREEIHEDVWEELSKLKGEGKIRFVGHSVSMYQDTAEMCADWIREGLIDVIQVVLSPFNREARPLIDTAIECNCGVVARECLANGFLSGTIREDTVFPTGSLNARYSREEIAERVAYANQLSDSLVREDKPNLPVATYRWILDQPGVSLALSGAKDLGELLDPVKASDALPYANEVLESVEAMHTADFGAA
ncbi:MAG: aldo/keto reductase [Verrucomicrobiae bacterium]|nr:aldo/keto reductase [Verrucomicrobiae bacterium]